MYKIAVVGATGLVGREILSILAERNFPVSVVTALASQRSVGQRVRFGNRELLVAALEQHDFSDTDICFMSAGKEVAIKWAPIISALGCIVIDNSSAWRYNPAVPLVIPEVNAESVSNLPMNIVSNPNCATIQLLVALKPLHDVASIKRVVVSTYQSVSGAGQRALAKLLSQTREDIGLGTISKTSKKPEKLSFNVIPHIDEFMEDGFSREEWKLKVETQKILDPAINLTATTVRVPVIIGHAEAVNVEFKHRISEIEARSMLRIAPGCYLSENNENYITPRESAGKDAVYIGRLRKDWSVNNGLAMWLVADNLRKGAALNAVQIAEVLLNKGLVCYKAQDHLRATSRQS